MSMPASDVLTPNCSPSRALSATSPLCSRALVGMQPRCRQVPPTLSFSIRTTDRPSSAPRRAAAYPPEPPPRMTRSAGVDGALTSAPQVLGGPDVPGRGDPAPAHPATPGNGASGCSVAPRTSVAQQVAAPVTGAGHGA